MKQVLMQVGAGKCEQSKEQKRGLKSVIDA